MALYNYHGIKTSLTEVCTERGFKRAQQFTNCELEAVSKFYANQLKHKILCCVWLHTDQLAGDTILKGEHIILGWFGNEEPPFDHPLCQNADVILCSAWLNYVMSKCNGKEVLEAFSSSGIYFSCQRWGGMLKYLLLSCLMTTSQTLNYHH